MPWTIYICRWRVRCGVAAQGQTRPCAVVRARRGRGGGPASAVAGYAAGFGQGRQVFVVALWVPSMGIHFLLTASAACWFLLTGIASVFSGILFSWNVELPT